MFKVRAHCTDFVREGAAGLSPGLCVSAHFFSNAKILMLYLPVASDMRRHTTTNLPVKYVLLSKCCSTVFILNSQAR